MGTFNKPLPDVATGDKLTEGMWDDYIKANIELLIDPPACKVMRTADQNLPSQTDTKVSFTAEVYDTDGIHDSSATPTRMTCQTEGVYRGGATVAISAGAFTKSVSILKNGVEIAEDIRTGVGGGSQDRLQVSFEDYLVVGDYIEVQVRNGDTSASTIVFVDGLAPMAWMSRA